MSDGILYLVSTPIGNLADMTARAIEILKKVDVIACEDTRHSKILLSHYGIHQPVVSYFDFSEKKQSPRLIARIKEGASIALISDAGTPGIADPGFRLIQKAIEEGVRVESIPGPSAFVSALVISGLPLDRFTFEGFFPVKDGQKRKRLEALMKEGRTAIFYESPHRILKTLAVMKEVVGNSKVVVARELTKKFEEVLRGTAGSVLEALSSKKVLGEFVVLFHPESQDKS